MGQDKALLAWQGTSLLSHQFNTLNKAVEKFSGESFVSGDREGFRCLPDRIPDQGPLAGIQAGFVAAGAGESAGDTVLLLLPVDMPGVKVELLENLVQGLVQNSSGAECVHYGNFEMPLVIRVTAKTSLTLENILKSAPARDRSVKKLIAGLDGAVIEVRSEELSQFANLNFMQEYDAAKGIQNESAL